MARNEGGGRIRREPVFGSGPAGGVDDAGRALRLSAEDRPGPGRGNAAVPPARSHPGDRRRREPALSTDVPFSATSRDDGRVPMPEAETAGEVPEESPLAARGAKTKRVKAPAARRRKTRRRRSFVGHVLYYGVVLSLWGIIALGGVIAYHFMQLPPIDQLAVPKRPPNIAIVAADGSLIANRGDTGGRAVNLSELPPYLPKAFVAIEDRRFYEHWGVDVMGIGRALVRNVGSRGVSQGGSTLTQQLAKNLFLTQERTLSRKIQEAILAVWLERNYSKNQILELYINRVYFGSGAYGVEAAAQRYFAKPAKDVTLAEAATLAGLVQAPSRLAPTRNPEAARARAQLVLLAMVQEGFIGDAKAKSAMMSPASVARPKGAGSANYAADYVMDVLDDFVGAVDTDIVVSTTIDPPVQGAAERALVDELNRNGAKFGVSQGAVVTLATDGAVKALVGGRNYEQSQFNRATTARRQPGSSFKPFVYLTALERGLTPDSVREDSPVSVGGWQPENYSRRYSGPMTLTTALAYSINSVAVKLCLEVAPKAVVRTAQRLGISSSLQANASIALGTSEVAPIEMVAAYTAFANGGTGVIPYVIRSVKSVGGKTLYSRSPVNLGKVIDPVHVGMMNAMMHETMVSGTAKKADLPGWEAAGKTGTSQDFRDAWFIGFTSRLVTGVWLGNDDGTPTRHASGATLPVEIWSQVMKVASRNASPAPLAGVPWHGGPAAVERPVAQAGSGAGQNGGFGEGFGDGSGNGVYGRPPGSVGAAPPPEKNFFERLFGG